MTDPAARHRSAVSLWVEGIATEPDVLTDGRRGHTPEQLRSIVGNLRMGTVPIVSRHGGSLLGWVDSVWAEGRDLAFTGSVTVDPDLARRLRDGRVPVSIETMGPPEYMAACRAEARSTGSHFRGVWDVPGVSLRGIAVSEAPAAPGSAMWRDTRPPTVAAIAGYWSRDAGRAVRYTELVQPVPTGHVA